MTFHVIRPGDGICVKLPPNWTISQLLQRKFVIRTSSGNVQQYLRLCCILVEYIPSKRGQGMK